MLICGIKLAVLKGSNWAGRATRQASRKSVGTNFALPLHDCPGTDAQNTWGSWGKRPRTPWDCGRTIGTASARGRLPPPTWAPEQKPQTFELCVTFAFIISKQQISQWFHLGFLLSRNGCFWVINVEALSCCTWSDGTYNKNNCYFTPF